MSDFGTPVANQMAYNPEMALQSVSALMGIRQQKQQLQTQRAQTQIAQAQAAQAQQENGELQNLHAFTIKAASDPAYKNEDGSLNTQKFQEDASKVAPTYGQAYIGQITQNANESIKNREAILNLGKEQRAIIGNFFGAVAADPNAGQTEFLNAVEQARAANKDPAYQRALDSTLLHAPQTLNMPTDKSNQAFRQYARDVALGVQAPDASESAPVMGTVQAPGGLQPYQGSPQSPMGVGPVGQPLKQGIAPQIVNQPGTGAPNIVGPNGQATPITGAQQPGKQNWWNPAPGQIAQLEGNTQGVIQRTQDAVKLANKSQDAMDALNRINTIVDSGINTGTAFPALKDMKNLAASLGLDTKTADNASELAKNVARYEAARAGAIGDTDASKALTEASGPNYKMDNAALKAVTMQSLAIEKETQMYAKLMTNASDPQTAMQLEQQFRSIPNLVQTIELGQMKTQKEVDDFMKRYKLNGSDIQKSRQMLQSMGLM